MATIAIIVQARMGSTRFPGKIMAPFCGTTVLGSCLRRCHAVKKADMIICATPNSAAHFPVWDFLEKLPFRVHLATGCEKDVLDRYYQAARDYDLSDNPRNLIVRITSDCPLIDPLVVNEVITLAQAQQADYTSNLFPRTYPKGFDTEVMTFEALEACWLKAKKPYDREHVTPWLQRTSGINRANLQQKINQSEMNFCVDYPEDPARLELLLASMDQKGPYSGRLH